MAQPERIETLVLGGGNGGMFLASHLARTGRRTAVVERRWIGGSCPHINCLPSKNEIWSSKVADLVHQLADRSGQEFFHRSRDRFARYNRLRLRPFCSESKCQSCPGR